MSYEMKESSFVDHIAIDENDLDYQSLKSIAELSGMQFCFWQYDPVNKKSKVFSTYNNLQHILFFDLNWPTQFLSGSELERYQLCVDGLVENHQSLDFKFEMKEMGRWIRINTRFVLETKTYEGIVRDITSEYLNDLALRNRTLELSAYDEGLDKFSIVARTDAAGKILYANNEFCRLSKYSYEELLGKDHRIVNSGHHSKIFFKEMWDCIKKGVSWRGLVKNKAKDGSFYWVDTIVIPIRDEAGELLEILSFRFDVTMMINFQEEIARLKKEINELKQENSKIVTV